MLHATGSNRAGKGAMPNWQRYVAHSPQRPTQETLQTWDRDPDSSTRQLTRTLHCRHDLHQLRVTCHEQRLVGGAIADGQVCTLHPKSCTSYDILQVKGSTFGEKVLLEHSEAARHLAIASQRRQRPLAVELCQDVLPRVALMSMCRNARIKHVRR